MPSPLALPDDFAQRKGSRYRPRPSRTGWSVGSSPNITTNWIANGGKWTGPVGGGFAKAVRLGEQAMKLELDAYYNAVRPKAGNETWLLQAKLTFQFPD